MKILYVEADDTFRKKITEQIEKDFNCKILGLNCSKMAMQYLKYNEDVDVVLSNFIFKDGNGDLIYNYLKEEKRKTPFVWVSSRTLKGIKAAPGLANFEEDNPRNGYVEVPNDLNILNEVIKKALQKDLPGSEPKAPKPKLNSGLRNYPPSEIIFNINDEAKSLYIIQKGQIRLFLPQAEGLEIEIATLNPGDVIGEMAYFDEKYRRRSCSASAIGQLILIEVSFGAFQKALESINPWFRTLIRALVDRLRMANIKNEELTKKINQH